MKNYVTTLEEKMLKAALVVTIAFVATVSVGAMSVYAQVAQGSSVVVRAGILEPVRELDRYADCCSSHQCYAGSSGA